MYIHSKDISKGLLLGKGLIYGTNFTNSTGERAKCDRLIPPRNLETVSMSGQINQTAIIDEFLHRKTNGFFIGTTHL